LVSVSSFRFHPAELDGVKDAVMALAPASSTVLRDKIRKNADALTKRTVLNFHAFTKFSARPLLHFISRNTHREFETSCFPPASGSVSSSIFSTSGTLNMHRCLPPSCFEGATVFVPLLELKLKKVCRQGKDEACYSNSAAATRLVVPATARLQSDPFTETAKRTSWRGGRKKGRESVPAQNNPSPSPSAKYSDTPRRNDGPDKRCQALLRACVSRPRAAPAPP